MHVYRLLLDLTSTQSIYTRIPPSIIIGYGFTKLTLLGGLPIKSLEGELPDLLKTFIPTLPFAILKARGILKVIGTVDEARDTCLELLRAKKTFVLQQFLKASTDRPFFVRLYWKKGEGIHAKLFESLRPYPAEYRPEHGGAYLARAENGKGVKLSSYTKVLVSSFLQLTSIIQMICAEELDTMSADYLQDGKGYWHFMSLSSYSYTQRKALTARTSNRKLASISTAISPRYHITVSQQLSPTAILSAKKVEKKLKFREESPGRPPYIEAPRRRKELQIEELVRDIIGTRGVLKHTTYKRWFQRTSSSTNYLPIDRLFATNIAKKSRAVHRSARHEVENLKALVRSLRRQQDSNQIITTKFVLFEVGKHLLKRLIENKNRIAEDKPKPLTITTDFQTMMSQKVLDVGNEKLALVRNRIKKG